MRRGGGGHGEGAWGGRRGCQVRSAREDAGELQLPPIKCLQEVAPHIARIRIAKGISQTELARLLGVAKQAVSRWEENDYQTVAIGRLQEILDAVGVRMEIKLTLARRTA
jgi:DNA-binding Xre family transcriptional regulator